MEVIIQSANEEKHGGTQYNALSLQYGKHRATVVIMQGKTNQISVVAQNASHRAFRGLGNDFDTLAKALSHYKSEAMRTMIQFAYDVVEEGKLQVAA